MKYFFFITKILLAGILSISSGCKLVCYYDISSASNVGPAKFSSKDMELALSFCTHVIYKYVTITPQTNTITAHTADREQELAKMKYFKTKYTNVIFLLSLGGENDWKSTETFLNLLESGQTEKKNFIKSLMKVLNKYSFDGLSLDLPLPTEKFNKQQSYIRQLWNDFKNLLKKKFAKDSKDSKASLHKEELTIFIQQLSANLKEQKRLLTLNVLPNVDTNKYFDVAEIIKHLDFVVISAFDFFTPQRNPEEADLMSPTKPDGKLGRRLPSENIKKLYKLWHTQSVPRYKIIIGVAAFGRSWKMTTRSNNDGIPPVQNTDGPATAGPQTQTPGFLSWPEICEKLSHDPKLTRVTDNKAKSGVYAFRPADSRGNFGIWISYEDPITIASKAIYIRNHNLGGVALFDINLDDIHGQCSGEKFPLLRSIKFRLTKFLS